jgi:hypothetical protein
VAATGFLPGVLSFLYALSHLERIAHRPTTYSSNLNHLSHLERVLYNWPTSPTQSSTACPQQPMGKTDMGFPTSSTMANGLMDMASDKNPRTSSICSDGGCIRFLEIDTGYPRNQHRLFFSVFRIAQSLFQRSDGMYGSKDRTEWGRTPIMAHLSPLFAWVGVDIFHPCNCMRSFSMRSFHLEVDLLPKELRIIHIIHMSFGIILNYYSQGLIPLGLTLSPFSHLPAPNPLPSLWMLSPPSLIHRVGLQAAVFIFY